MDVQTIATQVAEAIQAAPEKAQELVRDPWGTIEGITGATDFNATEVLQAAIGKVSEMGLDLSSLDLSQLDLSAIDVSKLNVSSLMDAAKNLGVDISKLDLGGLLGGNIFGGLGGMLGSLFGRK